MVHLKNIKEITGVNSRTDASTVTNKNYHQVMRVQDKLRNYLHAHTHKKRTDKITEDHTRMQAPLGNIDKDKLVVLDVGSEEIPEIRTNKR